MEQFDVLVVGSGGAGQRAALEVGRRKGLNVALITKNFPNSLCNSNGARRCKCMFEQRCS